MTVQDDIIRFLKITGPTIPSKVAKHVKTEILFASAHLSDLAAQRKVKISSLKIGGTPLYYLPGQEEQLYHFAAGNLNQKDYQVLEKLKEAKVLRETNLDLLSKVAMRSLKDFAIPLQVTTPIKTELFWRWYLLDQEETNKLIGTILAQDFPTQTIQPTEVIEQRTPTVYEQPTVEHATEEQTTLSVPAAAKLDSVDKINQEQLSPTASEIQKKERKPRAKKESMPKEPKKIVSDEFAARIESFFKRLKVEVLEQTPLRKTEVDYLVRIPSAVGSIKYVCKAKGKTKTDEKDLAAAYVEAQMKKLPLLYVYSGELTKKAQEMIDANAFENLTLHKVKLD